MSFESGFIKRAMQHGLCYRDAFELYKQAAPILTPQPIVDQTKAQQFAAGFTGKPQQPNQLAASTPSNAPGFGSRAWNVVKNVGGVTKDLAHTMYVAPVTDAIKETGDAWAYARQGNWSDALKSGGKALGNTALTALNFTPGLGLGATAARVGLRGAATATRAIAQAAKLRRAEQAAQTLARGSQAMSGNVLGGLSRGARIGVRTTLPVAEVATNYASTRDPLLDVAEPPTEAGNSTPNMTPADPSRVPGSPYYLPNDLRVLGSP